MLGPSLPSTPICLLRRPTVVVVAHDSVVWKLLTDFEHYAGKLPNCKSCKVYSRSKNMMMRTERIKVRVPAAGCHIPCHTHRLSLYVLVTPKLMWQYAVRLFALVDTASWHSSRFRAYFLLLRARSVDLMLGRRRCTCSSMPSSAPSTATMITRERSNAARAESARRPPPRATPPSDAKEREREFPTARPHRALSLPRPLPASSAHRSATSF